MFFIGETVAITQEKWGIKPQLGIFGNRIIIVWQEYSPTWGSDIFYQIRTRDGKKIISMGIVNEDTTSFNQSSPCVATGKDMALVVWEDGREGTNTHIYAQFFNKDGKSGKNFRIDDDTADVYHNRPHATFIEPDLFFIAWQDIRRGNYDIFAQWISCHGKILGSNIPVSTSKNWEYAPLTLSFSNSVFVVWQSQNNGVYEIKGKYVDVPFISVSAYKKRKSMRLSGKDRLLLALCKYKGSPYILWKDYRESLLFLHNVEGDSSREVGDKSCISPFVTGNESIYLFYVKNRDTLSSLIYLNKRKEEQTLVESKTHEIYNPSGIVINDTIYLVWVESSRENAFWDIHFGIFYTEAPVIDHLQCTTERPMERFKLYPPSPNPFKEHTRIRFEIPITSEVNILIYDALGRKVKTLVKHEYQPGQYTITWDGTDSHGNSLPPGTYFCVFYTKEYRKSIKIMIIR